MVEAQETCCKLLPDKAQSEVASVILQLGWKAYPKPQTLNPKPCHLSSELLQCQKPNTDGLLLTCDPYSPTVV